MTIYEVVDLSKKVKNGKFKVIYSTDMKQLAQNHANANDSYMIIPKRI